MKINRDQPGPGSSTSEKNEKLNVFLKKDPFTSSPKIAADLKESFGKAISTDTVRRYIKKYGFNARTARKKPLVNKTNRKKRVDFANDYKNKTNEFWDKVIFSDESKFNIFWSDGRSLV